MKLSPMLFSALGCALLSGAAAAESGVTAQSILLGLEEKTGAFSGDEENLGFAVAFQEANDRGGVHGRQIAWKGYVRTSSGAVAGARRLIDEDHVFALINFGGPATIEIAKIVAEKKVPYLFPHSALASSKGQRYFFTSFPSYDGETDLMFRYLAKERGLKRLAIFHDENAYGQLFLNYLRDKASRYGYEFVGNASVAKIEPGDVTEELGKLLSTKPDGIIMALYPAQAKRLMEAKAKLGWQGRMISSGPLTDEEYLNLPDGQAEGTIGFCYYPDPNRSQEPGVLAYRAAMEKHRPGHPLNRYSLYGYVFGKLVLAGLEGAGPSLTRESFIDAMERLRNWDSQGILPPVSFSAGNHHAQDAGFICELKQRQFEPLSGWIVP